MKVNVCHSCGDYYSSAEFEIDASNEKDVEVFGKYYELFFGVSRMELKPVSDEEAKEIVAKMKNIPVGILED